MAQPATARRPSLHAALTDKSLPELPKLPDGVSYQGVDPEDGDDEEEACPSPVVRKYDGSRTQHARTRVPPFRQSRRWARMHGWVGPGMTAATRPTPPSKGSPTTNTQPQSDADERILTLREASFEQQRAQLKPVTVLHAPTEDLERPRLASEGSSSSAQDGGFCRATASQYWRSVKTTVAIGPRGQSRQWRRRRSSKRAPARPREAINSRRQDRSVMVGKGRTVTKGKMRHQPRRSVHDGAPSTQPKGLQSSDDECDYRQDDGRFARHSKRSPIPSLHDPEKDSRFSEECRQILSNVDFDHDWMLPAASVLPAVRPPHVAVPRLARQITDVERDNLAQEASVRDALVRDRADIPSSTRIIKILPRSFSDETTRRPPARKSSKTIGSLEAMLQRSKTRKISELSKQSDRAEAGVQGQADSPTIPRLGQSQSLVRLPSSRSTTGPSLQTLRPAMSMDTLARIETQFQDSWPSDLAPELKKNSFSSTDSRHSGLPSIPPERPLPALPTDAHQDAQSDLQHRPDFGNEREKGEKDEKTHVPLSPPSRLVRLPLRTRKQLSSESTVLQGAQGKHSTDAPTSNSLRTKTSLDSFNSSPSLLRHKSRGSRAERVKEKRMRDLMSSRKTSTESVSAFTNQETLNAVLPPKDVAPTSSEIDEFVDQLDLFPSVPTSRPASMIHAHSRGQSYGSRTGHLRQLSKASSNYNRTNKPRQILSQSNIFVIVDSDPVTARFRAGAMSPSPSIGNVRRSESPFQTSKLAQASSHLREVIFSGPDLTGGATPSTIVCDREESKRPLSSISAKQARAASRSSSSSRRRSTSSDDQQPSTQSRDLKSPSGPSSGSKKRRRWNSTDIDLIKTLQQDLEEYYETILEQEEKIRWQAHQMQMMLRVMAPMNRERGLRGAPFLEAIADYPHAEDDQYPSQQLGGRVSDRPNSTGNDSSATASTASTKGSASADDASMTDPCEHEPEASAASREKHIRQKKAVAAGRFRQPPPVEKDLPKGVLPTTMSFLNSQYPADENVQGHGREPYRLSVNHVLANAEQMDQAIAQLRS